MIYIFTGLYCEAHALIQYYGLKKEDGRSRFQVFSNVERGIRLTVTGVGSIAAAVAVGSVCTRYQAGDGDFLMNIGSCAAVMDCFEDIEERAMQQGKKAVCGFYGEIFLCNKIIDLVTGRTFYPDILYRHGFRESSIGTGAVVLEEEMTLRREEGLPYLYDMEAAAVYQAGSYFFGPHQMIFLKLVSDAGNARKVTADQVEQLFAKKTEEISDYVKMLLEYSKGLDTEFWNEEEWNRVEKLCEDLHCSKVMRDSVIQHIRYFMLADVDYRSVIEEMYREGTLPCRDKREGKLRFEEFKRRLL